ncbi:MAG TPA: hypothetical protein VK550_36530 [Polyangiaceae bacterium]|nr:hypothetical protein [Polyangiaceae bacterium]
MKNVHPGLLDVAARPGSVGQRARSRAARVLALGAAVATLAWCFASCSYIEPQVGKFRGSCKESGGAYARPDAYAPGQPDPRCTPDEDDDACAICEDTHCCGTRYGCYDDDGCSCADEEFDECLEHIADPSSEEGVAATAHCWEEFSASGTGAKWRVDCQREFCQEECGVP